jgi:hypothetical protein
MQVVYDDGDFEDLELPDESVEILDDVTMLTPGKRPKTTAKPMVMEPAKRKQTLKVGEQKGRTPQAHTAHSVQGPRSLWSRPTPLGHQHQLGCTVSPADVLLLSRKAGTQGKFCFPVRTR